jgi:hypothetical protein
MHSSSRSPALQSANCLTARKGDIASPSRPAIDKIIANGTRPLTNAWIGQTTGGQNERHSGLLMPAIE